MKRRQPAPLPEPAPRLTSTTGGAPPILDDWCLAPEIPRRDMPRGYVWRPWVPDGTLTIISGLPESGKSSLLVRLLASVTSGRGEDVGDGRPPARAMLLGAEDDYHEIVEPRLLAAGADLSRLVLPRVRSGAEGGRRVALPSGIGRLEDTIRLSGIQLVVIDPIAAYCDSGDLNCETTVRAILDSIQGMAQRTGAAVCCTRNFNKRQTGSLLSRINGSAAWRDVPRSILCTVPHPREQGRLLLAHGKSSGPRAAAPRYYEIEDRGGVPYLTIGDVADVNLGDCEESATSPGERAEWRAAHELLAGMIGEERIDAARVYTQAQALGISKSKIWRAKVELAVRHERIGWGPGSHVEWYAPEGGWPESLRPHRTDTTHITFTPTPPPPPAPIPPAGGGAGGGQRVKRMVKPKGKGRKRKEENVNGQTHD